MTAHMLLVAATELAAPVPHDLTLPLPLSKVALASLLVGTFLLHILFVNLMVGGSLLTLFFEWWAIRRRDTRWDLLAQGISRTITVNKSLAVVLGVGPLLAMNLLYTVWFYAANSLTGIAWMMVVPLVTVAFLLTYAQKYLWVALQDRKGLHLAIGAAASLLFLTIPLIFLTNVNLMLFPERWAEVRGFLSALLLPNVLPRYLHFLLASIAATGLFLVWRTRRSGFLPVASSGFTAPQLQRLFYRITLGTTLLQFGAGPLLLLTLPRHGLDFRTLLFILSGVGFGFLLVAVLWRECGSSDKEIGKHWGVATVIFGAVVLFMGTGRHQYRETTLAWHRNLVAAKTEEFVRLSAQARADAEARAEAEESGDIRVVRELVYKQTGIACHQPGGQGLPGAFPPLAGSEWVIEGNAEKLVQIVLHGLTGPIRVKGALFSGAPMPAHRDLLNDRQIAAVLTYVRQAWGNTAPAVDQAMVSNLRSKHSSRSTPWTEAELGRPQ